MGDGHMHNEQLLEAVQKRCGFAPGELVLVHMESQPLLRQRIAYRIVDAAVGQLEAGSGPARSRCWIVSPGTTLRSRFG